MLNDQPTMVFQCQKDAGVTSVSFWSKNGLLVCTVLVSLVVHGSVFLMEEVVKKKGGHASTGGSFNVGVGKSARTPLPLTLVQASVLSKPRPRQDDIKNQDVLVYHHHHHDTPKDQNIVSVKRREVDALSRESDPESFALPEVKGWVNEKVTLKEIKEELKGQNKEREDVSEGGLAERQVPEPLNLMIPENPAVLEPFQGAFEFLTEIQVNSEGIVSQVRLMKKEGDVQRDFVELVLDIVRATRFKPAMRGGYPADGTTWLAFKVKKKEGSGVELIQEVKNWNPETPALQPPTESETKQ